MNAIRSNTMWLGLLLSLWLCLSGGLQAQGIPEPSVVFYGTVRNLGMFNARVTSGDFLWRVTRLSNGVPAGVFTLNSSLSNFLGQFSYVIEIPCESSLPGALATNSTAMTLVSTTNTYRFEAYVDGNPASFVVPDLSTFAAIPRNRGWIQRSDLTISAPCADQNKNQICDDWEDRYFGDFVDPNADSDGDSMSNRAEFLAGTDPTDPNSALVFVDVVPLPDGGFRLEWNSAEGRSYTLLSTSQLRATNDFTVVRSNLPATAPRNSFTDTNATTSARFYLIKLEL